MGAAQNSTNTQPSVEKNTLLASKTHITCPKTMWLLLSKQNGKGLLKPQKLLDPMLGKLVAFPADTGLQISS